MLPAVGAIIFMALAYTVLVLLAAHVPPNVAAAIPFMIPLIGLAGAAWAFWPDRKDDRPPSP